MLRRTFVRAGSGLIFGCAWSGKFAQAHTPFNQWVVYRRKHLLIGCHKEDLRTYALARQIVAVLESRLPTAKARIARAPTTGRLASLLGTDQLDVALLSHETAVRMAAGEGSFKPYGKIGLASLFLHPEYVLVGRTEIPAKHAWLIAHALDGSGLEQMPRSDKPPPLGWHKGANLFFNGEPLPEK